MVYIYKKLIHGKPYYYLRLSQRSEGKIITKDVAYLGNNIKDVEKGLDNLKKYQKEIRKSHKILNKFLKFNYYLGNIKSKKLKKDRFLTQDQLEQIEAIKLHYNQYFLNLDKLTIKETFKHFLIDFAFNTTSIEGNTITLDQVHNLLENDVLPKNKTLREVYDLQNTELVFFNLLNKKSKITEKLIVNIHDILLNKIDTRKGYRFTETRVFKSRFDASPAKYVKTDMDLLIKWYGENKNKLHTFVLASLMHHKFEKIHPFADGNGRAGRMLLNYILMKNKYPPLIVTKKRRNDYLNSLDDADRGNYSTLLKFLVEEMISSYWNNFNI